MRALIVSADLFEDSELSEPLRALKERGVGVDIAAPDVGIITGKRGHKMQAKLALDSVRPEDYEILIIPGGKAPARLQNDRHAISIARRFLAAGKPVAAICHGPLVLAATGLLADRNITCYHAIKEELQAVGAAYHDREVIIDGNLITSRQPCDIPAFVRAILDILGLPA